MTKTKSGEKQGPANPEADDENGADDGAANEVADADEQQSSFELLYGLNHVIRLFVPVTITMLITLLVTTIILYNKQRTQIKSQGVSMGMSVTAIIPDKFGEIETALVLAGAFLGMAVIVTFIVVGLVCLNQLKILACVLALSVVMSFTLIASMNLLEIIVYFNIPFDWISTAIWMVNSAVVGIGSIFMKSVPLPLRKVSLVYMSVNMAVFFTTHFPEWAIWLILGLFVLWDLFAVLTPCGPLRILVETAEKKNINLAELPGLVYAAMVYYQVAGDGSPGFPRDPKEPHVPQPDVVVTDSTQTLTNDADTIIHTGDKEIIKVNLGALGDNVTVTENDDEERSIKLGLGDFVFYSILVAHAYQTANLYAAVVCILPILIGLGLTLALLSIWKKALPALPISIVLGLITFFTTKYTVLPLADITNSEQIFI